MTAPVLIDVRAAEEPRDVIHRAVQALVEGKLVAFPTETVYGVAAAALDPQAVSRLAAVKGRKTNHPFTLAIRCAEEAWDYAPNMGPLADRLTRRCWPGPVTLVLDDSHPDSLVRRLPPSVRRAVSPGNTVGLRVPGHPIILDVLKMIAGPLVLTSANRSGMAEAQTAQEVVETFGPAVEIVLDDGPCRFGQPSSVVRVEGAQYHILREGVVPAKTIARLASRMILFVCTGNTCRSPMAEVICRKLLAQRLACPIDEVEEHGVIVASAGVAASSGAPASTHAQQVASSLGLDLSAHEAQPMTDSLVRCADLIYTMTEGQRESVVSQWPLAAGRVRLLCPDGSDICDPIGGPLDRYQRAASQIEAAIAARLNEMLA